MSGPTDPISERGAALVETAVLVSLVALVAVFAVAQVGIAVRDRFTFVSEAVSGGSGMGGPNAGGGVSGGEGPTPGGFGGPPSGGGAM